MNNFSRSLANLFCIITCALTISCTSNNSTHRNPSNIFDRDDRILISRSELPSIGSLHQSASLSKPWGTALLIAPCYIATAYHVVKAIDQKITGTEVLFYSTILDNEPIKARPVKWGKLVNSSERNFNGEDWAILRLETCSKASPFELEILTNQQAYNLDVYNYGFPEDRILTYISHDSDCTIGPGPVKDDVAWGHNCATRPGNSGGPIISSESNKVVALTVASRGYFDEIIVGYSSWIANKSCPIKPVSQALETLKQDEALQ